MTLLIHNYLLPEVFAPEFSNELLNACTLAGIITDRIPNEMKTGDLDLNAARKIAVKPEDDSLVLEAIEDDEKYKELVYKINQELGTDD